MGSLSSEDGFDLQSERFESYSLSADVSESESSSSFSCRRYDADGASSSLASSPLTGCPLNVNSRIPKQALTLPVIGGKDVVVWDEKPEKPEADFSEVEMMKERFAKLMLGEDMLGGGREYALLWQSRTPLLIYLMKVKKRSIRLTMKDLPQQQQWMNNYYSKKSARRTSRPPFNIFICYRGLDTKLRSLVLRSFRRKKPPPFLDYKSLKPGEVLHEAFEAA